MKQFAKSVMLILATAGLVACGEQAAQDWELNDNQVVTTAELDTTANQLAYQNAQDIPSPSFVTATDAQGNVTAAFYEGRIMSPQQATQLVQSGQLNFRPIQQIMQQAQNDPAFALRAVNNSNFNQAGFQTGNYQPTTTTTVRGRGRRVRVANRRNQRVGDLRQLVLDQTFYQPLNVVSSFFEIRYVSIPVVLEYAYVVPTIVFSTPTVYQQVVTTCQQQFGAFSVSNTCYQPWSVALNMPWQLQVTCSVPVSQMGLGAGFGLPNQGTDQLVQVFF